MNQANSLRVYTQSSDLQKTAHLYSLLRVTTDILVKEVALEFFNIIYGYLTHCSWDTGERFYLQRWFSYKTLGLGLNP